MTIRIVAGGLQTTVQDLGRVGYQSKGVPVGGAMDRAALRIGNVLVGNDPGDAALEASLIGPALTFESDALIALSGADLGATIDDMLIPGWHPVCVPRGATLRFSQARVGCRVYVAVAGGIDVPLCFGSRSTYLRGKFGGHEGRSLRPGDVLPLREASARSDRIARSLRAPQTGGGAVVARWSIGATLRPRYADSVVVRLIAGAHIEALTTQGRDSLFNATFRVSSSSDRMGYRLEGVEVSLRAPMELLSEGVTFGTVQLPPGGAPIILMADAQTTGGYPRIGEVASVDLPLVAQLKPGDHLRFRPISLDAAQSSLLANEAELAQARAAIALRFSRGTS